MKIYLFGDIHGNEYALDVCLEHARSTKADRIYCLGDLAGWLPFGDLTVARMRSLDFPTVAGNHDLMVAGAFTDDPSKLDRMQATAYNAGLLSTVPGAIEYLAGLPLAIEEEDFIIVHHSPFHLPPKGGRLTYHCFDYLTPPVLKSCLEAWSAYPKRIIFSGHDHIPEVYELTGSSGSPEDVKVHTPPAGGGLSIRLNPDSKYWVKAGSVGGPYRDKVPAANAVFYDTTDETITLLRLPYSTDRLRRELESHFFAPTLPGVRDYLALLTGNEHPD